MEARRGLSSLPQAPQKFHNHQAHFFWALHVRKLALAGVKVGFLPSDFMLARNGHLGVDCTVAFPYNSNNVSSSSSVEVEREAQRRLWHENASKWLVAKQCPLSLQLGEAIHCPWSSPACGQQDLKWQRALSEGVGRVQAARKRAAELR